MIQKVYEKEIHFNYQATFVKPLLVFVYILQRLSSLIGIMTLAFRWRYSIVDYTWFDTITGCLLSAIPLKLVQ